MLIAGSRLDSGTSSIQSMQPGKSKKAVHLGIKALRWSFAKALSILSGAKNQAERRDVLH